MDDKKQLIDEAVKFAGKILALAFNTTELKNHITSTLDFGEGGMFELKFTRINEQKILNEATVLREKVCKHDYWLHVNGAITKVKCIKCGHIASKL